RVAIGNEMPRTRLNKRAGTRCEQAFTGFLGLRWMFDEVDNLPFRDPAYLIQMQTPLALDFVRSFRRTKESIRDHGHASHCRSEHAQRESPVSEQSFQGAHSKDSDELGQNNRASACKIAHAYECVFYRNVMGERQLR